MAVAPSASATAFETALHTVFEPHGVAIEIEPVAETSLVNVDEGDPIDVTLTDRHGNVRSTTHTYPGPEALPELVGVVERELLADVDVTFLLLDPEERRWRFLLLSDRRVEALREQYGQRIEFGGRPVLADRRPIDFVPVATAGTGETGSGVDSVTVDDSSAREAGSHTESETTGVEELETSNELTDDGETDETDGSVDWLGNDDVDLADVGFEPATTESTGSDSTDTADAVTASGIDEAEMDRAFAEIEAEATGAEPVDSVGDEDETSLELELDPFEMPADATEDGSEATVPGPRAVVPATNPTPAIARIRVTPSADPVSATIETPPAIAPSDTPRPATTEIGTAPALEPTPAIAPIETEPTVSPGESPRPAVRSLALTPGSAPTAAIRSHDGGPTIVPSETPTPAVVRIDVTPGASPTAGIRRIETTPGSDRVSAVHQIGVVPGEEVVPAVSERDGTEPDVVAGDASDPRARQPSPISVRPSAWRIDAITRIGTTPGDDPRPAIRDRGPGARVTPSPDPKPAIRRSYHPGGSDVVPEDSPTPAVSPIATVPGDDPRLAVKREPFLGSPDAEPVEARAESTDGADAEADAREDEPKTEGTPDEDSGSVFSRLAGWVGDRL
jgi:hypothetical protein